MTLFVKMLDINLCLVKKRRARYRENVKAIYIFFRCLVKISFDGYQIIA